MTTIIELIPFKTHNDKEILTGGTHFQGELETTYAKLKAMFGKPIDSIDKKVDVEWEIEFEDGTVVTIYNWKNGKNYNCESGLHKTKITNWHIGGHSSKAIDKLLELLKL